MFGDPEWDPEGTHITSSHTPVSITESYDFPWVQGKMNNNQEGVGENEFWGQSAMKES